MAAYYNEFDPHAAAWLRELIKAGQIAQGEVDERSITEVEASDLKGFVQHHFFSGIGGWSLAARLAGWPDDKPLFTGSPPCQPFSTAGKQLGKEDARHLAPHWLELVRTVRPPFVAGEQVAAAINKDDWLDDLLDALEAEDYATGAIVLPASLVGSPHIRQRIFFVGSMGDSEHPGLEGQRGYGDNGGEPRRNNTQQGRSVTETVAVSGLANTTSDRFIRQRESWALEEGRQSGPDESRQLPDGLEGRGDSCGMEYPELQRKRPTMPFKKRTRDADRPGKINATHAPQTGWNDPDWLFCRDGKWRPVESGSFPLVNGLPRGVVYSGDPCEPGYASQTGEARVMRLKGYGNAIVPQVAAEVLRELLTGGKKK